MTSLTLILPTVITQNMLRVCAQSKELKSQNEQLQQVNVTLGSEVNKLQKQLEQARGQQAGGGQLTSLQEELERLREELQEAAARNKKLEEEHGTEKQSLQQVRARETQEDQSVLSDCENMKLTSSCVCLSSEGGGAAEGKLPAEDAEGGDEPDHCSALKEL